MASDKSEINLGKLHRPSLYRYRVADAGLRFSWNSYPASLGVKGRKNVIGVAVVIGSYAYCAKWGSATARTTLQFLADESLVQ